tara:strand:- start:5373 stop:6014 length:642 start_codon:yes stop_codon:yes gene_type:complete
LVIWKKKANALGYFDFDSIRSRSNHTFSDLDGLIDLNGLSINSFPDTKADRVMSERLGEAIGLSVINSIHGLTEADWAQGIGWKDERLASPTTSDLIQVEGSGTKTFKGWNMRLKKSEIGGTSRAIFQAFTQSIRSEADAFTFGPPQLVALRRVGNGLSHLISWDDRVWLNGIEVTGENSLCLECFNEDFERCDPKTGVRLVDAQRQPLPRHY